MIPRCWCSSLAVGIDGLIHFAGIARGGPLVEMEESAFATLINVNVTGVWRVQKHFFPLLRVRSGRTVLVSSEVGWARCYTAFSAPYVKWAYLR